MLELTGVASLLRGASILYWLVALLALFLAIKLPKTKWKKTASAAVVLGLFGYLPITQYVEARQRQAFAREAWAYFKKKCETESGEKIYKTFSGVKSVLVVKPLPPATLRQEYRNDPQLATGSGFSGTFVRNRLTGELTLSFRSTEFIDDAVRDTKATGELEIKNLGWALGQIAEMEDWYAQLRADPNLLGGKVFNVTGYSLGGHLATAFNILRREEQQAGLLPDGNPIVATYTFNGAGTGGLLNGKRLTEVLTDFRNYRSDAQLTQSGAWAALPQTERERIYSEAIGRTEEIQGERTRLQTLNAPFAFQTRPPIGEQATLQYQLALLLATNGTTAGASNFPPFLGGTNDVPLNPVFADASQRFGNMTEVVGSDAGNLGLSFVSNSGTHWGTRQEIYIEDQPFVRGSFPFSVIGGSTFPVGS